MVTNLTNSLTGLSLLSGSNQFWGLSGAAIESRAVRIAKAQFTTPATTPPWKEAPTKLPVSSQVSAIKRLDTIIDKPVTGVGALPPDVQTSFTTYKALDRLRLLAGAAALATTSAFERSSLATSFEKGLADLQTFLATAPSDKVKLAFEQPTRRADSIAVPPTTAPTKVLGAGVLDTRDAPLPGLTGNEVFSITLSKYNITETVTVDLSTTPQPPTLDSVAQAINAAVAAVPMLDANGNPVLDAQGNPTPRWATRMSVDKGTGKWGFAVEGAGVEKIAIDQVGAKDALFVATGQSATAANAVQVVRYDDPAGALTRRLLGTVTAVDRLATEAAELVTPPKPATGGTTPVPSDVLAPITSRAVATDAQGFSYVVGTTKGDLGSNLSDGEDDLFLTKLDSEGKVVWQRTLGTAGSAEGAAVSIAADGDIVVAGTVTGSAAGSTGDMLVARFDSNGDEKFATTIRTVGDDVANAVTVGADGSIYVGGRTASGGGEAFVARLDAGGVLRERRTIDGGGVDAVQALAVDQSGALLVLGRENGHATVRRLDSAALSTDLGQIDLGAAEARAITVADDGSIVVAGATSSALSGTQVNAMAGGRDGFVARIDAGLSGASVTYIGTQGDEQIDSVTLMNGAIYVGGRTTGDLNATRRGTTDGFITRIDASSGAIQGGTQFGQGGLRTEPVRISAAKGGASVLGAIGLHRGVLNPDKPAELVTQTSLRAGDEFSLRVDGGSVRKIVIEAGDTLLTLADRIRRLTGSKAVITTPKVGEGNGLRIEAKPGSSIELIAGADGKDALVKLGIEPARLTAPTPIAGNAPRVRPGGSYGLALSEAMNLFTAKDAAVALKRVEDAISMTQTAYRSLYWDDAKAALVDGVTTGGGSTYMQKQLGQYQAALSRLSSTSTFTGF